MGVPKYSNDSEMRAGIRSFLEMYPLYQAMQYLVGAGVSAYLQWPTNLSRHCDACKKETTWTRTADVSGTMAPITYLSFVCSLCCARHVEFFVHSNSPLVPVTLRKVGEYPAWSVAVPKEVETVLRPSAVPFYKKAVICLSQNFGLGAVTYFRRVVEIVIDDMLDLMESAAKLDPKNVDQAALDKVAVARASHQTSDKIELVTDLVPPRLKPGGSNPLGQLYGRYSEAVHSLSDEEGAQCAMEMRAILDYVLPELCDQLTRARKYQDAMKNSARVLPPRQGAKG